jgi:hypothetical protein
MTTENSAFNMDSILDGVLDDLADLPEFKPFPAGTHKVTMTIEQKTINKHPAFEITMKYVEPIELTDVSIIPPEKGSTTTIAYFMDNELGQGQFKEILKSLSSHFGTKSNRELIAEAQNAEVLVVTKVRQNKDKTQSYTAIIELQVV